MVINSKELFKLTKQVSAVISDNAIIPILAEIKFEVSEKILTLTGSNSNTSITVSTKIDCPDTCFCVPAKILNDTLANIPEQPLTITVDNTFKVTITKSNGTCQISGSDPKDFIRVNTIEGNQLKIDAKDFKERVNNTMFTASNDELRPATIGLNIVGLGDRTELMATDGYYLSLSKLDLECNLNVIVPKLPLKLLEFSDGELCITISNSHISFTFSIGECHYNITSPLIDAKPLMYQNVIPKDFVFSVDVDRISLINALKIVKSYAPSATSLIVLDFSRNELVVRAEDVDFNNQAKELIPIYCNENLTIGFNCVKFLEILNKCKGHSVNLSLISNNRPCVINNGTDFMYLIMPMMVS